MLRCDLGSDHSATGAAWRTVTTTYDGLGRATRSEQTSSASPGTGDGDRTSDDTLDAVGDRLTSAVRTGGVTSTTTYTVTALDQTIAQVRPDGSTTKLTYDPAGNPADRCYWKPGLAVGTCQVVGTLGWTNPPGQSTSTTYDARNSRIQQVDGLTNQVTTYDPDHNYAPAAVYLPTGSGRELQSLSAYDVRHRLISITHQLCLVADVNLHTCTSTTAAGSDTYTYDNNDNRTRVAEANGAASTDRFSCYDARDQLTKMAAVAGCASPTEAYTYDDAGNRTSALVAASTRTFTYTPDGQLSACANPACTITYDTTGRTSAWTEHDVPTNTDITWAYTYDSAGRLTSACKAVSCSGTGFDRLDFTYDGEGHRTRIVETPMAGTPVVTRDLRYQADAVVEESVNGLIIRSVIVDDAGAPTKLVVTNSGTANGTYLPTWNGHGDLLALWRTEADGSLTLAASVTYDTWGKPNVTTANGIPDLGFSRLYVGRSDVWWDNAFGAGLLYMHARTYSPTLGRFLQPDPVAAEGNLYGYAGNSPITKADASGTCWQFLALGAATAPETLGGGAVLGAALAGTCTVLVSAGIWLAGQLAGKAIGHPSAGTHGSAIVVHQPVCVRACGYLWAKDKRLSPGEAAALKRLLGRDGGIHGLKGTGGSAQDLFKKPNGDIVIKPKSGVGPGERTGWNIRDLWGHK